MKVTYVTRIESIVGKMYSVCNVNKELEFKYVKKELEFKYVNKELEFKGCYKKNHVFLKILNSCTLS